MRCIKNTRQISDKRGLAKGIEGPGSLWATAETGSAALRRSIVFLPALMAACLLPLSCGSSEESHENFGGATATGGAPSTDRDLSARGTSGAAGAPAEDDEHSHLESDEKASIRSRTDKDESETPECEPGAEDVPDDAFKDTNCDGIDGDVERAVFVASDGDDLGQGLPDDPFRTIGAAIAVARAEKKDVYICNGTYDRGIVVEQAAVNLYAGYDCANGWRRIADRATIAPTSGVPLTLRDVSGMTIERVVFEVPDAKVAEGSSMAGLIVDSHDIRLRRVEFLAKNAANGVAGASGQRYSGSAPNGADGTSGCYSLGCESPGEGGESTSSYVCPGGEARNVGGWGGKGGTQTTSSAGGMDASGPGGGRGGSGVGSHNSPTGLVLMDVDGSPGDAGRAGDVGALSEHSIGHFTAEQYQPSNVGARGGYGHNGGAGGGAGGGGAGGPNRYQGDLCCVAGHGGSQGGAGGCGGYPGRGGSGGGGSFGLVLVNSDASVFWGRFITGNGGRGGAGGAGGPGQLRGLSGDVYDERASGRGGSGSDGGPGGDGSPGGGGPSIALALVNSSLTESEEVQVYLANPGMGGAGVSGADGHDGIAAEIYDFELGQERSF